MKKSYFNILPWIYINYIKKRNKNYISKKLKARKKKVTLGFMVKKINI